MQKSLEVSFAPDPATIAASQLTDFIRFCEGKVLRRFDDYWAFERFCVEGFRDFWRLFARWSELLPESEVGTVCVGDACETARFFPEAHLNYADLLLSGGSDRAALTACRGDGRSERLTRGELRRRVKNLAGALQRLGVRRGDRVVAIARNNAEVVIAALAAAALGAPFSSCGVEMGAFAILSRFTRLEPTVLFANLRSEPWEHGASVGDRVAEVVAELPSLKAVVALDDGSLPAQPERPMYRLDELVGEVTDAAVAWERFPFDHPLFILFSSGTTGKPKCIMHGAGGTLLEHAKEHRLHCDLRPGDKLFFQTSPGWMMWNWQLSALASHVELVLYDGPLRGPETMWRIVSECDVTVFGTSAPYLQYCETSGYAPNAACDLSALRGVLSTGSILYPRQYDWVREAVKILPLQSISGGTDIIGCFVLGNPNLPVLRGQAQCRSLGLDVRSLPPDDDPCAAIGELICANPFPSRPIGFYGDPGGERFHEAYFSQHDGIWTHGDEVEFTPEHGWILHGRSDGVLNIRGIRVGPAEIYSILHRIDEIAEAMAVEQSTNEEAGGTRLVLLVVLRQGVALDARLVARIRSELLTRGSPALVPGRIVQVDALPITHSGKRSEAAARDALNGRPIRNRDALQNPQCLDGIADDEGVSALPSFSLSAGDDGATGDTLVQDLQRICEGVLRVPSVSPSDDVFTLGGDSLTILNLFVQIERRAGSDLPLEAMVAASTIEGIATLIRAGRNEGRGSPDSARPVPRVRPVSAADIPDLCRFLERSFAKSPIPVARWEALFAHTWSNGTSNPGFVLVCREELVGFVGTLYSSREINGKTGLVCNLTSWYVVPQYRGWALALIAAAVRDTTVTYTALTPSPITLQTLQNMGFSPLERRKIVLPPLMNLETLRHKRPAIELDAEVVRRSLSGSQRRLFDDHAAPECLQLTVEDSQGRAYIIVKRRRGKRVPLSEILYCSAPTVLARHLERVKFAILRRQRTLGLLVGEHLFEPPPRGISRRAFSLYRSPIFKAAELDGLYSEFVLLPV